MGIPKIDMKAKLIQLIGDGSGSVTDEKGIDYYIPQKESLCTPNQPFRGSGSLDLKGDLTLTGNLIVQQSKWVYLRGPLTSSAALINGPITGSTLLIRRETGQTGQTQPDWGKAEIEDELYIGGMAVKETLTDLIKRINELERRG